MVHISYGSLESMESSRNYVRFAGRVSIAVVLATLGVMMLSVSFFAYGNSNRVALDDDFVDPISRYAYCSQNDLIEFCDLI